MKTAVFARIFKSTMMSSASNAAFTIFALLQVSAMQPAIAYDDTNKGAFESNNHPLAVIPAAGDAPIDSVNGGSGALLENADIAIGSVLKSHHFNRYSHLDYNETHNGLYLAVNNWSVGTYRNSADKRSTVITYNSSWFEKRYLEIEFLAGIANGYEGWEYAQGDYLAVLGVSARFGYLRTVLLPDAIALGVEVPLN